MLYKIVIDDRNYSKWQVYDAPTLSPVTLDLDPCLKRLFSGDVFTYDFKNDSLTLVHSSVRTVDNIPAVLILADNKTYGRHPNNNKLLYKCVPDDIRMPPFLVPYELKHVGFSKVFVNQYVTIQFKDWTTKHPVGTLTQVIGPVDTLDCFYEYQLYCKSLNASIQRLNKDTTKAVKEKNATNDAFIENVTFFAGIERRDDWHVFTIDPKGSLDFDDAFSIKHLDNGNTLVSIYIANVTIWLDALNLWQSFSKRISTIYLPDKKRPMLPTILSDCLCSLQAKSKRFAFVLDLELDCFGESYNIVSYKFSNCLIKVFKNFVYEEHDLLNNKHYTLLFDVVTQLCSKTKYIKGIRDSHDLVCYLMVLMNYTCAKEMLRKNVGIFRSALIKKDKFNVNTELVKVPDEVGQFIKIWNSTAGQYIDISANSETNISHDLLDLDAYIHITSPIRRLVDLLNIIKFQQAFGIHKLSDGAITFYDSWLRELDYINTTMRAIRKVQIDCNLLNLCFSNPDILEPLYDGYCFDKLERNDGLFQYIVFLPELKITSRITLRDNLENYERRKYKLFVFTNEDKMKKKIRLQLT
uniref:RNB domain-containing protein n=1 Tax=viral metagenome TaxID=1070528 RepID=A0A6C0I7N4_9ZZZZ